MTAARSGGGRAPDATRPCYGLGIEFESSLNDDERKAGAHFTPPAVAAMLSAVALDHWRGSGPPLICDPSCGGGVFLIAAADECVSRGMDPERVIATQIFGADLSPEAVAASRSAMAAWCQEMGLGSAATGRAQSHVVELDALLSPAPFERCGGPRAFDIVVGNPPFQSQLSSRTARDGDDRLALKKRFGALVRRYVDTAALFCIAADELLAHDGVSLLIQPGSLLASADARGVREHMVESGALEWIWVPKQRIFSAAVDICAPLVVKGARQGPVAVIGGSLADDDKGSVGGDLVAGRTTWSELWAQAHDVPELDCGVSAAVVGDRATATAGFRDEYYGVSAHLAEIDADDEPDPRRWAPVVSTGLVDPASSTWGERSVRIGGRSFLRPFVDLEALGNSQEKVARWVAARRSPKVVVATQTKVIEAVADPGGDVVPLTPLISVHSPAEGVASLESALCAPPATVWALRNHGGGALSSGALKLSARSVLTVPLPGESGPWVAATQGLDEVRRDWPTIAGLLCDSWGADRALAGWWLERYAGTGRKALQ